MVESVLTYPRVVGEFETIKKVLKGYSIARFGDGEFKMAAGKGYRREEANPLIQAELQAILASPKPKCIVGNGPGRRQVRKLDAAPCAVLRNGIAEGSVLLRVHFAARFGAVDLHARVCRAIPEGMGWQTSGSRKRA
jgi:hypothetical protein